MTEQTTTAGTEVGRALIDRFGDIWRITPSGVRAPEADDHWAREQVERHYGPLREVVLVDEAEINELRELTEARADLERVRATLAAALVDATGRHSATDLATLAAQRIASLADALLDSLTEDPPDSPDDDTIVTERGLADDAQRTSGG